MQHLVYHFEYCSVVFLYPFSFISFHSSTKVSPRNFICKHFSKIHSSKIHKICTGAGNKKNNNNLYFSAIPTVLQPPPIQITNFSFEFTFFFKWITEEMNQNPPIKLKTKNFRRIFIRSILLCRKIYNFMNA